MKNKVSIDWIDLAIFHLVKTNGDMTTSQLAKFIFNPRDDYELRKKDSFIRRRLQKWHKLGVISYEEIDGKKHWSFPKENIYIGEAKLVIDGDEIYLGIALVLKVGDKWFVAQF